MSARFRIAGSGLFFISSTFDGTIDGVTHTDGIAISSADLGEGLSEGILVVQDDANGDDGLTQNFKLVSWSEIEAVLGQFVAPE